MRKKKNMMIDFILQAMIAYVIFVLVMYYLQDRFLYFPERDALEPEAYGLEGFEPLGSVTRDEVHLMSWWKPPLPGYPVVIYFHGNAGHLGLRAEKLEAIAKEGLGVLALSWRGYGASTGEPSENGLYEDGRAVLAMAIEHMDIHPESIILYGESLGSGVAVHLGALMKLGGVVLEAPYISILKRAQERFPILPVRLMLNSKFESIDKIPNLQSPLLVLHGEKDEVIPVHHGRTILNAAPEPKKGIFLPEVAHSDFPYPLIATEVMTFAREHGLLPEQAD